MVSLTRGGGAPAFEYTHQPTGFSSDLRDFFYLQSPASCPPLCRPEVVSMPTRLVAPLAIPLVTRPRTALRSLDLNVSSYTSQSETWKPPSLRLRGSLGALRVCPLTCNSALREESARLPTRPRRGTIKRTGGNTRGALKNGIRALRACSFVYLACVSSPRATHNRPPSSTRRNTGALRSLDRRGAEQRARAAAGFSEHGERRASGRPCTSARDRKSVV